MPLLTSDLYDTCKACVEGNLKDHLPQFDQHQTALGVVLVSGGYPGSYPKWKEITGRSSKYCIFITQDDKNMNQD